MFCISPCISNAQSTAGGNKLPKDYLQEKSVTVIEIKNMFKKPLGNYIPPKFEDMAKDFNEYYNEIGHHCYAFGLLDQETGSLDYIVDLAKKNNAKYINFVSMYFMKPGKKTPEGYIMVVRKVDDLLSNDNMVTSTSQVGLMDEFNKLVSFSELPNGVHGNAALRIETDSGNSSPAGNIYATPIDERFLTKKAIVVFELDECGLLLMRPNYVLPEFKTYITKLEEEFLKNGFCPALYIDATLNESKKDRKYLIEKLDEYNSDYVIHCKVELLKQGVNVIESHLMGIKSKSDLLNKKMMSSSYTGASFNKMMNSFNKMVTKKELIKGSCQSFGNAVLIKSDKSQPINYNSLPNNLKNSTLLFLKPNKKRSLTFRESHQDNSKVGNYQYEKEDFEDGLRKNYEEFKKVAEEFSLNIIFLENENELDAYQNKENTYIITPFVSFVTFTNTPGTGQSGRAFKDYLAYPHFYLFNSKRNERYYVSHGKKALNYEAFKKFLKGIEKSK